MEKKRATGEIPARVAPPEVCGGGRSDTPGHFPLPHNRAIRAERIEDLCDKIRRGEWKKSPPVEVLDTGRLWNGQHRLSAIVRSGQSVELRVLVWQKVSC